MIRDRGIVTIANCAKIVCPPSNHVVSDDWVTSKGHFSYYKAVGNQNYQIYYIYRVLNHCRTIGSNFCPIPYNVL